MLPVAYVLGPRKPEPEPNHKSSSLIATRLVPSVPLESGPRAEATAEASLVHGNTSHKMCDTVRGFCHDHSTTEQYRKEYDRKTSVELESSGYQDP